MFEKKGYLEKVTIVQEKEEKEEKKKKNQKHGKKEDLTIKLNQERIDKKINEDLSCFDPNTL